MEHVPCELCDADDTRVEFRKREWTLVRCRGCGLVYLDPRPSPAVLVREFDWLRHAPLQTRARRRAEGVLRRVYRRTRGKGLLRRKPRARVVLDRIAAFVPRGRVLDVGCGDGAIVEALDAAGYEAEGLDVSELAVRRAHARGRAAVRRGTILDTPLREGHYDAVLLMSYLEHEPHPAHALRRARAVLRRGGYLFVKVPHYGSWNRRLLGATWSGYFFPQHLYYFTPVTLERLFRKCGFEVVRNGFWDHVPLSDVFWATARAAPGPAAAFRPPREVVPISAPRRPPPPS